MGAAIHVVPHVYVGTMATTQTLYLLYQNWGLRLYIFLIPQKKLNDAAASLWISLVMYQETAFTIRYLLRACRTWPIVARKGKF